MYSSLAVAESAGKPFTDYSRWRLLVNDGGRHTWHYLKSDEECAKWEQNSIDRFWLGLPTVREFEELILSVDKSCMLFAESA